MHQFKTNNRISTIDSQIGTIRFVGILPVWGEDTLALGIEWDDPNCGRNNGDHDGVQYFLPKIAGSGSFIKSSNKRIDIERRSFIKVLKEDYLNAKYDHSNVKFGKKSVLEYGWEKLNKFHSDLMNLESLTLDHKLIDKVFEKMDEEERKLVSSLSRLKNLEVSCNLFESIEDIWRLLRYIPQLKTLNINGNRFNHVNVFPEFHYNLSNLKLAATLISTDILNEIFPQFPNLNSLDISNNFYSDADVEKIALPAHVHTLNLSRNKLQYIPTFKHLRNFELSFNLIEISRRVELSDLKSLDLRGNKISAWKEIDMLAKSLKNLENLKVNRNSLLDHLTPEESTLQIISRFYENQNRLKELNGSGISFNEIEAASIYMKSKKEKNEIEKVEATENNFPTPCKMSRLANSNELLAENWLNLNFVLPDCKLIRDKFLNNSSVLKLKGSVSKMLNNTSIIDFELCIYNEADQAHTVLHENFNTLHDYYLKDDQSVYINLKNV